MKVAYYPGCSSHGTGIELDSSTREICALLGIELDEIKDWNCCGSSSAHMTNHDLGIDLAARNLAIAEEMGHDIVVTPCSACYSRLAAARKHVLDHGAPKAFPNLTGKAEVWHIFRLFSDEKILSRMREKAAHGLNGMKLACYYGCLTSRPQDITEVANPDNPTEMEAILESLGGEVFDWPLKTQCCGASLTLTRDEIVGKLCGDLIDMARRTGAEAISTGCPMCFMNLDRQWRSVSEDPDRPEPLPVFYFTELMLLALDPVRARGYFKKHLGESNTLLAQRELA